MQNCILYDLLKTMLLYADQFAPFITKAPFY